ncbi:MAG: hypothetical protein ACLQBX_05775 [Candidatus Limnocylindrales bacterium]|jgi:hypothetical protein
MTSSARDTSLHHVALLGTMVPPLQPGTYYFHCEVHPTLNGPLVVK